MGTKMAVAFANIFMSAIETEIIRLSPNKPLVWKRYIDDVFSQWNIAKQSSSDHKIYGWDFRDSITFLRDTCVHKGYRFERESIHDVRRHFKPTESFQYT